MILSGNCIMVFQADLLVSPANKNALLERVVGKRLFKVLQAVVFGLSTLMATGSTALSARRALARKSLQASFALVLIAFFGNAAGLGFIGSASAQVSSNSGAYLIVPIGSCSNYLLLQGYVGLVYIENASRHSSGGSIYVFGRISTITNISPAEFSVCGVSNVVIGAQTGPGPTVQNLTASLSFTYTYAGTNYLFTGTANEGGASYSITSLGSAGPTASQQLRSLQVSLTPVIAVASGEAISSALDTATNEGFNPGSTPTSIGSAGGFLNFAPVEPSSIAIQANEAFSALAYAEDPKRKGPIFTKAPIVEQRFWSAWASVRASGFSGNDTNGNGNNLRGTQVNLNAGIGYKITPDTLVGAFAGYENASFKVPNLGGSLNGEGGTIGSYFAQRFLGNLRFDAAVAFSRLNYNVSAAGASGSFSGNRVLVSTGLTGNYKVDVYNLEPSAKLFILWEHQGAWTDSTGTAQATRDFSVGRTALGSKIGRTFDDINGWSLTPSLGLYADWRFQTDNALPTGTTVGSIGKGWAGRGTAGLSVKAPGNWTVALDGEYGGLGATYKTWSGKASVRLPF